jgi:DNA mismatch repair protein MutL
MSDIINLLPDAVANQIAAGEVIQRPASAVKELLENAIDSGANEIKLYIKDAGKTLIQVIDNGCGMSPVDARMSFERHATSKITTAEDLFAIRTKGFRGEALASIAAIAQVELKTRKHQDELGSKVIIEGSKIVEQSEVQTAAGTNFIIKNLFFNTPARRNFLKSDKVENRHIHEEFIRVALVHPDIAFHYYENDQQKYILQESGLKRRIVALFGKKYNEQLLEIGESTGIVNIGGFVGKPEIAKKTRGEQYLFVNNRFIKHSYFNHAVTNAFDDLLPDGTYPSYFIYLEVEADKIDINIHPTKTEINFQDDRSIYSILKSAVKMALGKFALSPRIDFDIENSIDLSPPPKGKEIKQPQIQVNPDYNPFETSGYNPQRSNYESHFEKPNTQGWEKMYDGLEQPTQEQEPEQTTLPMEMEESEEITQDEDVNVFQIGNQYLATHIKSGLLIAHQQYAHERVLYDRFSALMGMPSAPCQKLIFPETVDLNAADTDLLNELSDEFTDLGFELKYLNNNTFELNGVPTDLVNENQQDLIEKMLDYFKQNQIELKIDKRENFLRSMAKNLSIRSGRSLFPEEQKALITALLQSSEAEYTPDGKAILELISLQELAKRFSEKGH